MSFYFAHSYGLYPASSQTIVSGPLTRALLADDLT